MRRFVAACFVLGALAGPALACINDSELPGHEREFRSQYARRVKSPVRSNGNTARYWILGGAGAAMLTGGAVFAFMGRRSRS